jgi:hypothetical protein
MNESNVNLSIDGVIKDLDNKEKALRKEINTIRRQRAELKSSAQYTPDVSRYAFLDDVPPVFWYPIHWLCMFFSELNPVRETGFAPPDKQDWVKKGSNKEALFNLVLAIVLFAATLKVLNIIL